MQCEVIVKVLAVIGNKVDLDIKVVRRGREVRETRQSVFGFEANADDSIKFGFDGNWLMGDQERPG